MQGKIIWLGVLLAILSLGGCSLFAEQEPMPGLLLLPPEEGPPAQLLKQRATLYYHDREQQFLIITKWGSKLVRLAVLMPFGQTLLTLEYDGQSLKRHSAVQDARIPARDILAMVQFAHWPQESLQDHYLTKNGWQIQLGDNHRLLLWHQRSIINLIKRGLVSRITRSDIKYNLRLEILDSQSL